MLGHVQYFQHTLRWRTRRWLFSIKPPWLRWELTSEADRPAGRPALSGQDETLGSKGEQVKSAARAPRRTHEGPLWHPRSQTCDLPGCPLRAAMPRI